ncbi:MAG: tail fiber domain-containing protein [Flavobacteriia bacterium]
MKKQLLFFSLLGCGLAFGQNQSNGPLSFGLSGPETFRFGPGIVTQDQSLTGFNFGPTNRWLSFGEVSAGSQTFYGNRFQYNERALVTGYTSLSPNNPRIEWIHNGGSTLGNLEFRVAKNFLVPVSEIVAIMTPQANTYFSKNISLFSALNPKVGISFDNISGLQIISNNTLASGINPIGAQIHVQQSGNYGIGLQSNMNGGMTSIGVLGKAEGDLNSIGVLGVASSNTQFGAGIYGNLPISGNPSLFAGFFDGDVYLNGLILPSDAKLKENIVKETNILDRIYLLNPVTYNYKKTDGLNLSQGTQHGFISQEMAEVFPELTRDITKPVFDKDGKIVSELSFKAINYVGMISILTEAIKELNVELIAVRQDLDDYKANDVVRSQLFQSQNSINGYSIEQNVPNPFSDKTSIRFQLAPGVESSTLSIFNLNGTFVKDYSLEGNSGEVEILASEIGKGMFIYSLNQNGQEIISKRMIVK